MVDETTVLLTVFVVLLIPFPLTSVGTTGGPAILWQLGLTLLIVAGIVPPFTRYMFNGDKEGDETDDENEEESEESGNSGNN